MLHYCPMELQQTCVTDQVICVSLTITLSSTQSPQYMFESWLQYCKSYNHICIDWTAQFERKWQQEKCNQSAAGHYSSVERCQERKDLWLSSNSGPTLGSSSFAYEHAHTPWNQASTCTTIVLMLYTYTAIDRHLRAWKRHQAKPSRTFHRRWSTRWSSYCRKHRVCTDAKGRLKRCSTPIAEAMLKVN